MVKALKKGADSNGERMALAEALDVCACFNFRKASRAVTQLFDEALQPSGLRSTQLVILLSAAVNPGLGISKLARELVMDASTLNRNLKPLAKRGLISVEDSKDGRRRLVTLTPKGEEAVRSAVPLWNDAQSKLVAQFGTQKFKDLLKMMVSLVSMARA
jgi:DNA-binding MarR family transcriptional regulator